MQPDPDTPTPVVKWFIRIEWKPQDCWVGVFWKRRRRPADIASLDVWVCIVPMLPIHFGWYVPFEMEVL